MSQQDFIILHADSALRARARWMATWLRQRNASVEIAEIRPGDNVITTIEEAARQTERLICFYSSATPEPIVSMMTHLLVIGIGPKVLPVFTDAGFTPSLMLSDIVALRIYDESDDRQLMKLLNTRPSRAPRFPAS